MDPLKDNSPDTSPNSRAIRPGSSPTLAATKAQHDKIRLVSLELQKTFDKLSPVVYPLLDPDDSEPDEPDPALALEVASLGIELAKKKQELLELEREILIQERDAGIIRSRVAEKRLRDVSLRHISAGDDLWQHQRKKARFDDSSILSSIDLRHGSATACLLALYKKSDGLQKPPKRPSSFRSDALTYYDGKKTPDKCSDVWCHVTGKWWEPNDVIAAHVVPFFLDGDAIGEILFGDRAPSLRRAGNALLLSTKVKKWFDTYKILIVPVNASELPITRWRVDVITSDIRGSSVFGPVGQIPLGQDLDGQELTFRNDKRPVSRFMYFHFLMALIRIKDARRQGWEDTWSRYYTEPPFPTPTKYIRNSMLLALVSHFGPTNAPVVDSWMKGHGHDMTLKLTDDEATEAARRVHLAVEEAYFRAERYSKNQNNDGEGDEEEDDEGEEEEEEDE
ncbi:hypothetical protein B0T18DRAFT_400311 [Schizothecium vesticola]|uniref:HNH nuclease domain-containing protein n=1 Tax=Schizothecium vesticola TaxID=314040 RepID=A0AA40FBW3_9PEZI|nr:hypothetical protein B0T18DRAFT_400311 [Schizothecium vesticola]